MEAHEIQRQIDARTIAEFNSNFTKFEGSNTCTIHDIVSLANFANKNNADLEKDEPYYVKVIVRNAIVNGNNKSSIELTNIDDYENYYINLVKENTMNGTSTKYYKCEKISYTNLGEDGLRVNEIVFKFN